MDTFHMPLLIILALNAVTPGWAGCLTGCSCTDDSVGRSLLCMETPMGRVPEDVPGDLTKIRIENSRLSELPPGSFSGVPALEFLWLNFNDIALMSVDSLRGLANLTELRLQGNKLSSVPWTAFRDTPSLKILDLKHNRLDVLPEHALGHLPGLTYFDVSFNRLSVVSRDVFLNWPLYRATEKAWGKEGVVSNVVLALHDNPWLCDCRLKGFVEFVRAVSPPLLLMNSYLTCSGPGPKAGRFFHEIQLKTCSKPVASAPRTNITLPPGAKLTLTCLVKARPDPTIHWTYSLKIIRGFSVTEAHVDEETVRSQLEIPSLQPADRGSYTCAANNFIGNSSATIGVDVRLDNSSGPVPVVSSPSADENVAIDVRIAKQTVYGVTLEWYASTADPADTWFTIHFGKYDSAKKETIYIGPGINSYSVSDLLPVTKYEVCVTLKNRSPRAGQCIVFVTGSDVSALEQRERLIHVVVIVCAMALAVPAGMYACTTEARFRCPACCSSLCRKRRMHSEELQERQGTFDSLQAASDEGLCRDMAEEGKTRRRSEDKSRGGGAAQLY